MSHKEKEKMSTEEKAEVKKNFNIFYEDVFNELAKYGEIEEMIVCDNLNEHMVGNVYVRFRDENNAKAVMNKILARYYGGKLIQPSYTHVVDFKDARCKQHEMGRCSKGGFCNFIHVREPNHALVRKLLERQPLRVQRLHQATKPNKMEEEPALDMSTNNSTD